MNRRQAKAEALAIIVAELQHTITAFTRLNNDRPKDEVRKIAQALDTIKAEFQRRLDRFDAPVRRRTHESR